MTISQASKRIAKALQDKRISFEDAVKAQAAIRERKYYGNSMTPKARQSIVENRFGI